MSSTNRPRLTADDLALRPGNGVRNPWLREALALEPDGAAPRPAPDGDLEADVAIVGGGYTGLWTAWFLAERDPELRIVVLEQDICGGGPSGRNGGFVNGWWDELPTLVSLFGAERGVETARESAASVHAIGEWCAANGVDAHYVRAGMLTVSTTPLHDRFAEELLGVAVRAGVPDVARRLTPQEVGAICASPAFREGLLVPDAATVQPALLARRLRRVLLGRGVEIFEQTRVRALRDRDAVRVRLRTEAGHEVRARQVVLALNAWAAGWRPFRRSVLAWGSYMVRSEPIPERLRELGWTSGTSIVDARFSVHYLRTTRDGRIAIGAGGGKPGYGGRIGAAFTDDHRSSARAAYAFRLFFPQLDDVRLTDAWGGPIDVSPTHLPRFGTLPGGRVHFGFGYSGNGVAPSHLGGRILAALACGSEEALTRLPIVGPPARRFPPEPFRFVGARILREAMVRREDREELGRRAPWALRQLTRLPRRLGYQLGPE